MQKKDIYVNRLESITLSIQTCILQTRTHAKCEPIEQNFEGLQMKNEIYQQIGIKKWMRKMGSFVQLSCLLPELWSLKCQKCSLMAAKTQSQAKYLSGSDRPHLAFLEYAMDYMILSNYQQDSTLRNARVFLETYQFSDISILSISLTVTPKSISHTNF